MPLSLSSQLPALALLALLVPHLPLRLGCRFSYYSLLSPTLPSAVAVQGPLIPRPSGWLSCFSQPPGSGIRPQMLNCKYLTLSLAVNQNQGKLCVKVTAVLNLTPSIPPAFFSCVSLPFPHLILAFLPLETLGPLHCHSQNAFPAASHMSGSCFSFQVTLKC